MKYLLSGFFGQVETDHSEPFCRNLITDEDAP